MRGVYHMVSVVGWKVFQSLARLKVEARQRTLYFIIVQELCESRAGRPGLAVLTSFLVSVDVKLY